MSKRQEIWAASLLLLILFSLQVTSAPLKSPTYDEQVYIARGYAFVKLGDQHILVGEPVFLDALHALPLLALPDVRLPVDHPSWAGTNFHPIAERFMWYVNHNTEQILFMARIPTMFLTLLLAVFLFRWARELFGLWGSMLSLVLCVFDPNLIAHGQLATSDLGSTVFIFVTVYWAWKLLRRPTWLHVLMTGLFYGLALSSRFSALLFAPGLAAIFLLRAWTPPPFALALSGRDAPAGARPAQRPVERLGWLTLAGVVILGIALLTIWATHGFQVGSVPGWASFAVPAPSYWQQLQYILPRLSGQKDPVTGFLMGQLYVGGKWQYFPVAFLLKTPLPTLLLLIGALVLGLLCSRVGARHSKSAQHQKSAGHLMVPAAAWLPPLLYFAITLTSKLNLGYRYILPVLPFAILLAGRTGHWLASMMSHLRGARLAAARATAALAVGWSAWGGLAIYPHYLAFFNEIAGGPENGWHYLVDSNLDWGQDLKLLRRWMDRSGGYTDGVERIKLGYYGEGVPSYYGIQFDPLICSPDRWQHPLYHDLYSADPAPGIYAISVDLLQGRHLADPDTYAWFRQQTPIAKIGYSIFIYQVPVRGSGRAVLALSQLQVSDVQPADYARLGTNDVHVLWFDATRSIVAPRTDDPMWVIRTEDTPLHPMLAGLLPQACDASTARSGRPIRLCASNPRQAFLARAQAVAPDAPAWHLAAVQYAPGDPAEHGQRLSYPLPFGDRIELLGYEIDPPLGQGALRPGQPLTLVTYWRAREPVQVPIRLFLHLLDSAGTLRAGEDRLDVWYGGWQEGDLLAQVQQVTLDADTAPGLYQMEIGCYNPQTMQRLPLLLDGVPLADRVLLEPVTVEP